MTLTKRLFQSHGKHYVQASFPRIFEQIYHKNQTDSVAHMKTIDVYFSAQQLDELSLRDMPVIMIDVLRASTTIITAVANGAREIIPVASVEGAMKIVGNLFGSSTLLCGERGGQMIHGFHLGNSPREFTREAVEGKSLIMATTNGSLVLTKAKYAHPVFISGFVNITATLDALDKVRNDDKLIIACAGKEGGFSLEDALCAGMLIDKLSARNPDGYELSDSAAASNALYHTFNKNLLSSVRSSDHGKFLIEHGFADDIPLCVDIDSLPIVPILEGSVIKSSYPSVHVDGIRTPTTVSI